eukprot:COSAG02_NODE_441_length_22281_cov_6.119556_15_plen_51_part_00
MRHYVPAVTKRTQVSDGVFGDTLGIQNDVTRELANLGRNSSPHLVRDEDC